MTIPYILFNSYIIEYLSSVNYATIEHDRVTIKKQYALIFVVQ